MSREIKFRGKRLDNNEWVYGSLCLDPYRGDAEISDHDDINLMMVDVNPDTVGQFTGLEDNNGKEIYEGDILDCTVFDFNGNDKQYRVKIEWCYTEFCGFVIGKGGVWWNLHFLWEQDDEIEVIGNIYDNPELLK